jgi:hypothetical protein
MKDFAILYKDGKSRSYFRVMSSIGPAFGGTVRTAARFVSREHAAVLLSRFPIMASACCRIVELAPLKTKARFTSQGLMEKRKVNR